MLGTITGGVQNAVGRQATVNIAYDPNLIDSPYESTPILAVFGELDLSLIVRIVLSLFAILFTFDAIVGEREHGTLKLMLANRMPRDQLILGKALGGLLSLLVPLIIPFVICLLLLQLFPDIALTGGDWARIGLMFALFILYLSVFFAVGLLVSARSGSSTSSLFILLFVWVTFIFIVPKGAVIAARNLRPIPSTHEITAQKDAFLQNIQAETQERLREYILANPAGAGTPESEAALMEFIADLQQKATDRIDENNESLERDYQARRNAQQSLSISLSLISPASALTFGSMSLARTGLDDHERFLNSIKTYKPVFTKWANDRMMANLRLSSAQEQATPDISDMPQHEYVPSSLRDSLGRAIPSFAVLALMIVVFLQERLYRF